MGVSTTRLKTDGERSYLIRTDERYSKWRNRCKFTGFCNENEELLGGNHTFHDEMGYQTR